jgi:plastocyanin
MKKGSLGIASAGALTTTLLLAGMALGQSPNPSPGLSPSPGASPPASATAEAHAAHIHAGTCADLGDVVSPLEDVTTLGDDTGGPRVEASVTRLRLDLDDILAAPHAIMAHLSPGELETYIACGDLVGTPSRRGELVVPLAEQSASGHAGVAFLVEEGGRTVVYLSLTATGPEVAVTPSPPPSPVPASPAPGATASPSPSPASTAEVRVSAQDFLFEPSDIEIAVGTIVTWTNDGASAHTATADDASFDSGVLRTGESFSFTFDAPGTHTYICIIHPSMRGTVTVS